MRKDYELCSIYKPVYFYLILHNLYAQYVSVALYAERGAGYIYNQLDGEEADSLLHTQERGHYF